MKLFFFDIDGTLCEPGKEISEETVHALHEVQKKGHKIFLSTGRNVPTIQPDVMAVGFDGVIASSGGYVCAGDVVLEQRFMPLFMVEHAMRIFNKYGISYFVETEQATYADMEEHLSFWRASEEELNSEQKRMRIMLLEKLNVLPLEQFQKKNVFKFAFIGKNAKAVQCAVTELGTSFDTVLEIPEDPNQEQVNGETMLTGLDKGVALQMICEHYGIPLEDSIAFGDSSNDLSMLKKAGTAIVMGNAASKIKEYADIVCESCEEQGVALQLKRMGYV